MSPTDLFADPRLVDLVDAAVAGDGDRVASLVAAGVDPNARGEQGVTPLLWTCVTGDRRGVAALVAAGADPNCADDGGRTPLQLAAMGDEPALVEALLDGGADPGAGDTATAQTPLAAAIRTYHTDHVRRLIAAGADPSAVDGNGDTLLHLAGKVNAYGAAVALLEAGVDPTVRNGQDADFKEYFDMAPAELLTASAAADLARIEALLAAGAKG